MSQATQPPAQARPQRDIAALIGRGVVIPSPEHLFIAQDVPLEAIAPGVVLHPFTRLSGGGTRLDAGAVIGASGPATLENAWVGKGAVVGRQGAVTLRDTTVGAGAILGAGIAENSVFLGREGDAPDFTTGAGFRTRKGTLYEEGANSAQFTDTKMTILLPWVTLGSNLNWCYLLVAGGTGPQMGAFTEIGSGAIHFNFTPRGDKATGSLLGNVCDGVFLRTPRLFIGGNVSLIGPIVAAPGAMTPAGGRHAGQLSPGMNAPLTPPAADALEAFDPEVYGGILPVYQSQVRMIGELSALVAWYEHIRLRLAGTDASRAALYQRGLDMVWMNLRERIHQMSEFAARVEHSVVRLERTRPADARIAQQRALVKRWPELAALLAERAGQATPPPPELIRALEQVASQDTGAAYTLMIRALPEEAVRKGRDWLRRVAGTVAADDILMAIPALAVR